jgi:hypothetical protein
LWQSAVSESIGDDVFVETSRVAMDVGAKPVSANRLADPRNFVNVPIALLYVRVDLSSSFCELGDIDGGGDCRDFSEPGAVACS